MTQSTLPNTSEVPSSRLRLPRVAVGLLIVSVPLLLFGGFIYWGIATRSFDTDLLQTKLGMSMLWAGLASLLAVLILVGVRAIAQQHLNILLNATPDRGELQRPNPTA